VRGISLYPRVADGIVPESGSGAVEHGAGAVTGLLHDGPFGGAAQGGGGGEAGAEAVAGAFLGTQTGGGSAFDEEGDGGGRESRIRDLSVAGGLIHSGT
jgi:hypothetical protein